MEKIEEEIKENYEKNLKAVDYVASLGSYLEEAWDLQRLPLTFLHKQLLSGKFRGSKALEIGSGAVVHNIVLVSAFYSNIIMSDYVEDNCEELKRWLQGNSTLNQFLDIPAEIEGYGKDIEAGKKLIEKRIRENVKQVVRCDALHENILLEEAKPEVAPPYDLIISSLCLESAAPDFDSFALSLKRINKMLRPGGRLFLVGFFEGGRWPSGQADFHYLKLGEDDLRRALKESGFGNVDLETHKKFDFEYDHQSFYYLIAEKV